MSRQKVFQSHLLDIDVEFVRDAVDHVDADHADAQAGGRNLNDKYGFF